MRLYFRLFGESVVFAVQALTTNRLRTFLSLLGVTIGIFAIISVFTLVDSMERSIRGSIEQLGNNVVFVQKWPWSFEGSEYPWWRYINRPHVKLRELKDVEERSELAEACAYMIEFRRTLEFKNSRVESAKIIAGSKAIAKVRNFKIAKGRYFSESDFKSGRAVCVLGDRTAYDLFGSFNPIGKSIQLSGRKVVVIGVFEREGESMINASVDRETHLTLGFAASMVDPEDARLDPRIMVRAKDGISNDALIDELTGVMRSVRRLNPLQEQNFALNEVSILSEGLDGFFKQLSLIGLIIGGFSILVGGFSIANIMYVSVKERTNIIGIEKSLGAKNSFILFQFLTEAVMLTTIGGSIGLIILFITSLVASGLTDFEIVLTLQNVLIGIGISVSIGLFSGLLPALTASRLDPVEAMRAK
tara:strand:- start:12406 stop:13656 length:1251 start_codon:yes stop_codon:yes gene_type:complete